MAPTCLHTHIYTHGDTCTSTHTHTHTAKYGNGTHPTDHLVWFDPRATEKGSDWPRVIATSAAGRPGCPRSRPCLQEAGWAAAQGHGHICRRQARLPRSWPRFPGGRPGCCLGS